LRVRSQAEVAFLNVTLPLAIVSSTRTRPGGAVPIVVPW
jgi:hypothetical protein